MKINHKKINKAFKNRLTKEKNKRRIKFQKDYDLQFN
jgi:hypothetical protein